MCLEINKFKFLAQRKKKQNLVEFKSKDDLENSITLSFCCCVEFLNIRHYSKHLERIF
jgi:hypothetical protein